MKLMLLAAAVPLALASCVTTNPQAAFNDVGNAVSVRSGQKVRWMRDESERLEIEKVVGALLQSNLTARSSVAIALLNNRALQSEFESIGISQADLAEASRIKNPQFSGSWRLPNRPPTVLNAEYGLAQDVLDLLLLPARKKMAERNLQSAKLRVAHLSAPTTVHWHGILLPSGMDGVGGVSQRGIQPGETFKYEFPLTQHGAFMYHSHHDEMTQMQLGMMGLFIIHPQNPPTPPPDRDYAIMLSEWKIEVGARRPDPNEMTDFNIFTMNARAFPGTLSLLAKVGDRVRVRIGNLSTMSHHAIHLHGHHFKVVETDGGAIPESGQWPETTVIVPTGSTRTIEFTAVEGDWVMHCHMLHHVMNQMGHTLGNVIGINTNGLNQKIRSLVRGYMVMGEDGMAEMGEMGMAVPPNSLPMIGSRGQYDYITMGGMFTIVKVRAELPGDGSDPAWYVSPPGTLADIAPEADLKRDGIELPKESPKNTAARAPLKGEEWCGTRPPGSTLLAENELTARIKVR